jgi:hypothetical protein
MATMAEQGSIQPTIITSGIIFVLIIWSLYAFSAAGVIIQLPFVRVILVIITTIYLLRGVAGLSWLIIRLNIAIIHIIGLKQVWLSFA